MDNKPTVKSLRCGALHTQRDMAKYLGISKATYVNKENGITKFNIVEGIKLAEKFGKKVEEINFF